MQIYIKIYKIILVTILSCFLTSCSDNTDKGTLIVATSADNPPYENMKNGEIVGFDIDLMNEVGKHLGKKIEFRNMEFYGILASLSAKNVDMAIAAMSVTTERQAMVDFSVPYTDARIAVLFRQKDHFNNPDSLKGKIIGAQLGTIWALIANEMSLKHNFKTLSLANNLMLVEELKNERIDAMVLEEAQVVKFIEKNPMLASFSVKEYGSSFAIALPKDSPLKKDIDLAIEELKKNGTIDSLSKKWGIISEG